jgi:3-oxoadipate enol-lactonase
MQHTPGPIRIAYDTNGGEGRPRLLMVMGFGMRGTVWLPQVEGLGPDHTLAWFDNRGIGESDLPPTTFRMRELAQDALRVADDLGWQDFHVVGVSLGGMISQEVALAAPERVRSLTLIATHAGGVGGLMPTAKGLYHWVRAAFGPQASRVANLVQLLYPPTFIATVDPAALRARMQLQVGQRPPSRTALMQLWAVIRHNTRAALRRLRPPTLILKPEADLLVRPYHSDFLHAAIPGSRLQAVPDAGHGLTFHAAEAVNEAIRSHVAAHDAAPPRGEVPPAQAPPDQVIRRTS